MVEFYLVPEQNAKPSALFCNLRPVLLGKIFLLTCVTHIMTPVQGVGYLLRGGQPRIGNLGSISAFYSLAGQSAEV